MTVASGYPQYLIQSAAQYGMEPGEFIKVLDENGQIPAMVGEVARAKTLAVILDQANVVDTKGNKVDVSEFTAIARNEEGIDTTDAANLLAQANEPQAHSHASGTDSHGRKASNEHYGHDHN